MLCPHCNIELVLGQAIRTPNLDGWYCRSIAPIRHVLTIDNLSFQFCGKCPNCGYSDDDVTQWAEEIIERVGHDKWSEEYGQQYRRKFPDATI